MQFPVLFQGEEEIYDEHKTSLDEALGFLDVFLEGNDFVAGKNLTVADCCLVASVSSIVVSNKILRLLVVLNESVVCRVGHYSIFKC